jgi:hypothetical protein
MNFKFLNAGLGTVILGITLLVNVASASPILEADWHLTTDTLGGLRQSTYDENVYFAVTQHDNYLFTDTFEIFDGFHWASTAEATAIFGTNGNSSGTYVYFQQGGWAGHVENIGSAIKSYQFILSDSVATNKYKNAQNYDEHRLNDNFVVNLISEKIINVGGLVLIKDRVDVPEPTTLAIFALGMIGLASRRFKKQS